jgi:hypothetical protein
LAQQLVNPSAISLHENKKRARRIQQYARAANNQFLDVGV